MMHLTGLDERCLGSWPVASSACSKGCGNAIVVPAIDHSAHIACSATDRMLRPVTLAFASLMACSSPLPRPPTSPHTPDEFVEVPHPPPTARSEMVPPRPHTDSAWVDGEWQWQAFRWGWRRGAWVVAPDGATLARWQVRRDGVRLWYAVSVLHLADGGSLAPSELRDRRRRRPGDAACTAPAPASFSQRAAWPAGVLP